MNMKHGRFDVNEQTIAEFFRSESTGILLTLKRLLHLSRIDDRLRFQVYDVLSFAGR